MAGPTLPYPQGLFTFTGGITSAQILSAEITQTHSITPDLCVVQVPLGTVNPSKNGDVTLTFGDNTIKLKGCTIDFVEQALGDQLVWNITILDRRWKWRDGAISGRYNVKYLNGTGIRRETQKNLRELAKLCLSAMGEKASDKIVNALPANEFPEVEWVYAKPAEALLELCERFAFRVIYDYAADEPAIVRLGSGADFDPALTGFVEKDSLSHNPPELPSELALVCGPSSAQYDFALVPKGLAPNGLVQNLDDLPYHPLPSKPFLMTFLDKATDQYFQAQVTPDFSTGTRWDTKYWNCLGTNPTFCNVRPPYYRQLALDSVLRWYQIVVPQRLAGLNRMKGDARGWGDLETFPAWDDASKTFVWQFELQSDQIETIGDMANIKGQQIDAFGQLVSNQPLDAWVYGNYVGNSTFGNTLPDRAPNSSTQPIAGSGVYNLDPSLVTSTQQVLNSLGTSELEAQENQLSDRLRAGVAATGFYTGGFSIDAEHALVKFDEMVYQMMPVNNPETITNATDSDGQPISPGSAVLPACLWLRTRFFVRDPDTRATVRYERRRKIKGTPQNPATGPVRYIFRDDLTYRLIFRPQKFLVSASGTIINAAGSPVSTGSGPLMWADWKTEDNKTELDKACDSILDQVQNQLLTVQPRTVIYLGLVPQRLDGAMRQVTWRIDGSGARTFVARDTEILYLVRDYRERRLMQRLNGELDKPVGEELATSTQTSGLI